MVEIVDEATKAMPDNINELIGALVSLIIAIWGAFKRGKEVGTRARVFRE